MHDGVLGIAGGEQDLQLGPQRDRGVGQLTPVHSARHDDVREQKVELPAAQQVHGVGAVGGHFDVIAEIAQLTLDMLADQFIVLDDQYAVGAALEFGRLPGHF